MELASQIGGSVTDGLAYVGSLASLGGRAARDIFIGPFHGKPVRLGRVVSQAMDVGLVCDACSALTPLSIAFGSAP